MKQIQEQETELKNKSIIIQDYTYADVIEDAIIPITLK